MITLDSDHVDYSKVIFEKDKPAWVYNISGLSRTSDESGSVQYRLIDRQVNMETQEEYCHQNYKIIDTEGAQMFSEYDMSFDPSYQSFILNDFKITKPDKTVKRITLKDIQVAQRETEFENYVYNGSLHLLALLKDVQPGDEIDISYTKKGLNPILQKHFDYFIQLQYFEKMDRIYYRIVFPNKYELFYRLYNTNENPLIHNLNNNTTEWVWDVTNSENKSIDYEEPIWFNNNSRVQISSTKSWQELALWGMKLYEFSDPISKDIENLVKSWNRSCNNNEEKILKALRFVQNDIQYFGIENGTESYKPRSPNEIFENKYGDCKEKVYLLKTILNLMNIQSHPVLVNSDYRHMVEDFLPSPNIFNHVILQIINDRKVFYVDPTISCQEGSLEKNYCPDYQRGLVLNKNSKKLITIESNLYCKSKIVSSYILDEDGSCNLGLKIIYEGKEADDFRSSYMNNLADYSKFIGEAIAHRFGKNELIQDIQLKEYKKNNIIQILTKYKLENVWDELETGKRCYFLPFVIQGELDVSVNPMRNIPLSINYPVNTKEVINVFYKDIGSVFEPRINSFKNENLSFTSKWEPLLDKVTFTYHLKTFKDHVSENHLEEHRNVMKKINDEYAVFIHKNDSKTSQGMSLFKNSKNAMSVLILSVFLLSYFIIIVFRLNKALIRIKKNGQF